MEILVKRIYEEVGRDDGTRVLVDRLWPRGISKAKAAIDRWDKEIAPSNDLRKWYAHDPEKFAEFITRYRAELDTDAARAALRDILGSASDGRLTLLTATKAVDISQATALQQFLTEMA